MTGRLESDPADLRRWLDWDCDRREERANLSDDEFWDNVTDSLLGPAGFDADDFDVPISNQGEPCPECGEHGACGYDAEGRAMIHVATLEDEGDDDE